jgi:hypothetical protein
VLIKTQIAPQALIRYLLAKRDDKMPDKHDKVTGLIAPHGGYRELKSHQNSEIVYDTRAAPTDKASLHIFCS